MAEVLAGFVCGYGLALVATPVAALALLQGRAGGGALARRLMPEGSSVIVVSVMLHGLFFMLLTAVGILFGVVLNGMEERAPAGGLGSPNGAFTAFILVSAAIAVLPLALVLRRWRVALIAGGLAFALCFGWIMPYLSLLGPGG
jgi:hypothetical protein